MLVIGRQGLWAVATTSGKQKRHSSQQRAMLPCCCCCHVLADDACALWCILAPLNLLLGCLLCSIGWTCLLLFDWVPIALLRYLSLLALLALLVLLSLLLLLLLLRFMLRGPCHPSSLLCCMSFDVGSDALLHAGPSVIVPCMPWARMGTFDGALSATLAAGAQAGQRTKSQRPRWTSFGVAQSWLT